MSKTMAIESSCDETAAAVVKQPARGALQCDLLPDRPPDQMAGVVPEIASRKHIEKINQVIEEALADAGMTLDEMTAVGVTYGPGLVCRALFGVEFLPPRPSPTRKSCR